MTLNEHIKIYGKPTGKEGNTWYNLAKQFGYISGEAARKAYRRTSTSKQRLDVMPSIYTPIKVGDYEEPLPTGAYVTNTNTQKIKLVGLNGREFNVDMQQVSPKETILVIPDLHIPAHLPDALAFCKKIRDEYKATKIIFIGDIVDNYCVSLHAKDPDFGMTANQEIEVTKYYLKEWHDAFPYATVISGNHDMSRIFKSAKITMLPKAWIKDIKDVLDTPTWNYTTELVYNGIYFNHGESSEATKVAIYKGMSTVQGHMHTKAYINWVRKDLFAVQVGTLVDRDQKNFDYAKNTYLDWWNGVCVIKNGVPMLIPYVTE